jgi:SAM-dependent methyltransferase
MILAEVSSSIDAGKTRAVKGLFQIRCFTGPGDNKGLQSRAHRIVTEGCEDIGFLTKGGFIISGKILHSGLRIIAMEIREIILAAEIALFIKVRMIPAVPTQKGGFDPGLARFRKNAGRIAIKAGENDDSGLRAGYFIQHTAKTFRTAFRPLPEHDATALRKGFRKGFADHLAIRRTGVDQNGSSIAAQGFQGKVRQNLTLALVGRAHGINVRVSGQIIFRATGQEQNAIGLAANRSNRLVGDVAQGANEDIGLLLLHKAQSGFFRFRGQAMIIGGDQCNLVRELRILAAKLGQPQLDSLRERSSIGGQRPAARMNETNAILHLVLGERRRHRRTDDQSEQHRPIRGWIPDFHKNSFSGNVTLASALGCKATRIPMQGKAAIYSETILSQTDAREEVMTQNQVEKIEPWRERWLVGQTGWDQGRPHPELGRLLQQATREGRLPAGARLFSAGCGRAHNEAWLAEQGYQVDAVDAVPEAIAGARALYGEQPGLHLAVADVFAGNPTAADYDAVFDRAMLCAIQPEHRAAYVQKIADLLKPGGLFMAILFRRTRSPDGPPFAVDEVEAQRLFADQFDLCHASCCPPPPNPHNVLEEWLCIWRKRSL